MADDQRPADDQAPADDSWRLVDDQVADFEQAHAEGSPGDPGPEAPPAADNRSVLVVLLTGFRELSCALLEVTSPQRTLADPIVERIAGVVAPVCDKRGVNLAAAWGQYALEAGAVLTAGPLLWTAWRELDAELRARKAKPIEPETPAADAAPAAAPAEAKGAASDAPAAPATPQGPQPPTPAAAFAPRDRAGRSTTAGLG